MQQKFIQKDDLGDILDNLAEKAVNNAAHFETEIIFRNDVGKPTMEVVIRCAQSFEKLIEQSYTIIDHLCDDMDIIDETLSAAKAKREKENN